MFGILKFEVIAGWKEKEEIIGTCFVNRNRGNEIISFEYNKQWLKDYPNLIIDPDLSLLPGRQYPGFENAPFGFLADSSPDRWGRKLMERKEIEEAITEKRPKKTLLNSDYLLMVSDECRGGGIRFRDMNGNYLSMSKNGLDIPPMTDLRTLEAAAIHLENHDGESMKYIMQLITPGSSLGGARPKANVRDLDGSLWIAKFPSRHDENNIGAWEMVAHDLAKLCELNVPDAMLLNLSEYGSTFLSKRFDRKLDETGNLKRIHFASAMTMLQKRDGESEESSYLDIVAIMEKTLGETLEKDLMELWRRIVFNICISNTDDHLRNHGFLLNANNEWTLSPVYDLNPIKDKDRLSLLIDYSSNEKDLSLPLEICDFFRIPYSNACQEIKKIYQIVQENWRLLASKYGISKNEQEQMKICFIDEEKQKFSEKLKE